MLSNRVRGYALVVLAVLLWAGNAVVGRLAPDSSVPPIALNFWRWVIAFIVLLPIAWPKLKSQRALLISHWRLVSLFGVVAIAGFNSAFYIGFQHTTVVQGTLISAVLPILVLVGAAVFLRRRVTVLQIVGAVVSIVGVGVMVLRGNPSALARITLNIGDLWVLIAVSMWAAQIIAVRFVPKDMDLVAFQVASFLVGLTVLSPLYLIETISDRSMPATWEAAMLVAYAAVAASVIGFTCWNRGVLWIGAQTAGYFGNLFPVFGTILGVLLLGEILAWYHWVGGVLILIGICCATAMGPRVAHSA